MNRLLLLTSLILGNIFINAQICTENFPYGISVYELWKKGTARDLPFVIFFDEHFHSPVWLYKNFSKRFYREHYSKLVRVSSKPKESDIVNAFCKYAVNNHVISQPNLKLCMNKPIEFVKTYCLTLCAEQILTPEARINAGCPNPCGSRGSCLRLDGVTNDQCILTGNGIFSFEYSCICNSPEYEFHPFMKICLPKDPCDPTLTICDQNNTIACHANQYTKKGECICLPGFTGPVCNQTMNPCEEINRNPFFIRTGTDLTGNMACNVERNNKCIPEYDDILGPIFKCECNSREWVQDPQLHYDNCRLPAQDVCSESFCINGYCITSPDRLQYVCDCYHGYGGQFCEKWVGVWSEWTRWQKCRPACGEIRYSARYRDCEKNLNATRKDCDGSSIEFYQCEPVQCQEMSQPVLKMYFVIHSQNLLELIFYVLIIIISAIIIIPKIIIFILWILIKCVPKKSALRQSMTKSVNRLRSRDSLSQNLKRDSVYTRSQSSFMEQLERLRNKYSDAYSKTE